MYVYLYFGLICWNGMLPWTRRRLIQHWFCNKRLPLLVAWIHTGQFHSNIRKIKQQIAECDQGIKSIFFALYTYFWNCPRMSFTLEGWQTTAILPCVGSKSVGSQRADAACAASGVTAAIACTSSLHRIISCYLCTLKIPKVSHSSSVIACKHYLKNLNIWSWRLLP